MTRLQPENEELKLRINQEREKRERINMIDYLLAEKENLKLKI